MMNLILIGLGGCLGAISRYLFAGGVQRLVGNWEFPLGTLSVNVMGCFLAGLLLGVIDRFQVMAPTVRLFLFTGFLGGLTTFSAFGLEAYTLFQKGQWALGLGYSGASFLFSLLALGLGARMIYLI